MKTPAQKLIGTDLPDGWKVVSYISKDPLHTGGNFSAGYIVESRSGIKGFLKALDFKKILGPWVTDVVTEMRVFTETFEFERNLLRQCKTHNLNRIIRLLADGSVIVEGTPVPYLILEIADTDLRKVFNVSNALDSAWILRTMHNISVGIQQLHGKEIAHQDLKPSNVLFVDGGKGKIGDFGRSATKECRLPHIELTVAGDPMHSPPEGLYGYTPSEWKQRRFGCDTYQLGSLLVFMFTGTGLTTLMQQALHDQHRSHNWSGGYEQVLPYLSSAFRNVVIYVRKFVPEHIADEVCLIISELGNPDLNQRGDPIKRRTGASPFMMERYISRFDRLATALECNLFRAKP